MLSTLALCGCWADKVHRPTSAAGAICAEQCDQQRYSCNSSAENLVSGSRGSCQSQREHVEERCSPWVKDSDKQRCQLVNNPGGPSCVDPSPDYGSCTTTWRSCIVSCGGWFE
ncbi:hypothetical protein [Pseudoxanthomonas sp. GM95]|uniref:hypothetical protein n=1 Tax=Pseudoxanthomonas sp. GM95 TaxID=1881043 RepID=UPI000B86C534|nr:hypothetical protein [Pseudoxanthomonas sp. GM95]